MQNKLGNRLVCRKESAPKSGLEHISKPESSRKDKVRKGAAKPEETEVAAFSCGRNNCGRGFVCVLAVANEKSIRTGMSEIKVRQDGPTRNQGQINVNQSKIGKLDDCE
jgi:hypothetical protein